MSARVIGDRVQRVAGATVVIALLAAAQSAPPPPATAPTTAPVAPTPPPSNPVPSGPPVATAGTAWFDIKPLTPKLDAMRDVQPATGVLARCTLGILRAVPSFDGTANLLSWRVEGDHVALVAKGTNDRSAVLANLNWRGPTLEWQWARCSATSFTQALAEAERLLPWMAIRATLDDQSVVLLSAQPLHVVKTFSQNSPVTVNVPGAAGRALSLFAAEAPGWTAAPGKAGELQFSCSVGQVNAAIEPSGRVRVEVEPPGGIAISELRKQIAERTQELRRATPDEKRIIDAELEEMRARIVKLEKETRAQQVPWPALPTLRVRDANGRDFAVLELQPK